MALKRIGEPAPSQRAVEARAARMPQWQSGAKNVLDWAIAPKTAGVEEQPSVVFYTGWTIVNRSVNVNCGVPKPFQQDIDHSASQKVPRFLAP
jgi:hypothetical protein